MSLSPPLSQPSIQQRELRTNSLSVLVTVSWYEIDHTRTSSLNQRLGSGEAFQKGLGRHEQHPCTYSTTQKLRTRNTLTSVKDGKHDRQRKTLRLKWTQSKLISHSAETRGQKVEARADLSNSMSEKSCDYGYIGIINPFPARPAPPFHPCPVPGDADRLKTILDQTSDRGQAPPKK